MLSPTRVGGGILQHTVMQDAEIAPSPVYHLVFAGLSQRISVNFRDGYNLRQCGNHPRQTL